MERIFTEISDVLVVKNGTTGGFASSVVGQDGLTGIERAKVAGSKGGKISKRGKSKKSKNNGKKSA